MTGPCFHLCRHRFQFEVLTPVYFPELKADNVFRGMAGLLLPKAVGGFANAILNPNWPNAPSGFSSPPKPFQFRAHHLDGRRFQPGANLHVDVHQFASGLPIRESLEAVMKLLETEGIGPGRGKLRFLNTGSTVMKHELTPVSEATRITLNFLTPTEIDPAFNTLIVRLHERINALSTCYGGNPLLPPLARVDVRINRNETKYVQRQRGSTRTGQTYETGGIIGQVQYEGPLTEALPFLQLGQWTGVAGGVYEIKIK